MGGAITLCNISISGGMVGNEKLCLLHIFNGTLLKVVARPVKSTFEVNMRCSIHQTNIASIAVY